jgi:hypothetical protein
MQNKESVKYHYICDNKLTKINHGMPINLKAINISFTKKLKKTRKISSLLLLHPPLRLHDENQRMRNQNMRNQNMNKC